MSSHLANALADNGLNILPGSTPRSIGGGDISASWRVETEQGPVFVKSGSTADFDMFDAEADGLTELREAGAIRVPEVVYRGLSGSQAFIAMEWLEFDQPSRSTEHMLGEQLADLHRHTAEQVGWHRDNTIGRTPQHNDRGDDWIAFFREHRLEYQLTLAAENGFAGEVQTAGLKLAGDLEFLFDDYEPVPSLLHGDLWGGNQASCNGCPVIFDPAVYYGDRETDLAMTRLFGGFGSAFYDAYQAAWPLATGYERRLELYQLYHVLNHLNLFGSGYLGRAMQLIESLNRGD